MKLQIQRQGIVIRSVDVAGDRARIGSGEDCEVRIDDPYLSAHVADLVNQNGQWRIVDAGTSLEGVTRNGQRVEDEPIAPGTPYTIGGFDLVAEGAAPAPPRPAAPPIAAASLPTMVEVPLSGAGRNDTPSPKTMMESDMSAAVPRTMYEAAPAPAPPRPPAAPMPAASGFQPIGPATVANSPLPGGAAPGRRRLLIIVGSVFVFLIVIMLLLAVAGGSKKKPVAKTATAQTSTVATTTAAPPSDPARNGDRLLGELKIDDALASWEQALDRNATPELRAKYAKTALEVGLVYAANNDAGKARGYFEKVVKYGPPDSPQVAKAKAKLQ